MPLSTSTIATHRKFALRVPDKKVAPPGGRLRNAYDRALSAVLPLPWTHPASTLFAPRGGRVDATARFRAQLADARANAVQAAGRTPAHGDVVAQLGFGFWRYLTAKSHEKALWVPYLHKAFPPGTDRARDVDAPLTRLNKVRNRVAHHEPLLRVDLLGRLAAIVAVATLLDPDLGRYVAARSTVQQHVTRRPR